MSRPTAPGGRLLPAGAIVAAAVLFGTTGTAQALGPATATPLGIGTVRLVLGATALCAVAALLRPARRRDWRRHAIPLLVGGLAVAVYQLGWFAGLRRTGVALGTVVGIGSGPVLSGILHALRGRALSRRWMVGTVATGLGLTLMVAPGAGARVVDAVGLALVLAAVLGYVLYVEAAQHAIRGGLDVPGTMAGVFGVGAVLLAPLLVLEPLGWLRTASGAAVALHLGLATVALAYALYGWGLRWLPAPTAITLTLAEPLTAAVLGTAVLGERMGALAWLGAAMVGVGLAVAARAEPEPPPPEASAAS